MTASIDIAAPKQDVWDFAMDPRSTLEWVTIVRGIGEVDEGPLRKGFQMEQMLSLHGFRFKVRWTLVELDAPHSARWEGKGPARSTAVIQDRLTSHGDVTRFDYTNEFHAPFGPLGLVVSKGVAGGMPEREAIASLKRLKEILEGGRADASAR